MKSTFTFTSFLILFLLVFVSCNKEELEVELQPTDTPELRTAQLALPDLVATAIGSDISAGTTTICGPTLPNGSCAGGDRFFFLTILVENIGNGPLPPGTLEVVWFDITAGAPLFPNQQFVHGGLAVGENIRIRRPLFLGPCDCAPPFTSFIHSYVAGLDPSNLIPEVSDANNRSPQYDICDGC